MKRVKAFTLIELLIVVAIIAILAAIAVPNFLEAQTRAKVTRCKADMRSVTLALGAFSIDYNFYPPDGFWQSSYRSAYPDVFKKWDKRYAQFGYPNGSPSGIPDPPGPNFWRINCSTFLTTPMSYMTMLPQEPFSIDSRDLYGASYIWENLKDRNETYGGWIFTVDPTQGFPTVDGQRQPLWMLRSGGPDRHKGAYDGHYYVPYDPTNGTVSEGDIFRAGP